MVAARHTLPAAEVGAVVPRGQCRRAAVAELRFESKQRGLVTSLRHGGRQSGNKNFQEVDVRMAATREGCWRWLLEERGVGDGCYKRGMLVMAASLPQERDVGDGCYSTRE